MVTGVGWFLDISSKNPIRRAHLIVRFMPHLTVIAGYEEKRNIECQKKGE